MSLSLKNLERTSIHLGAGPSLASASEATAACYKLPCQSKELPWSASLSKADQLQSIEP
jgi:hypothetical protein